MNSKEAIEKLYNIWKDQQNDCFCKGDSLDNYFTKKEQKCMFLSSGIVGITTYDGGLDKDIGEDILETLVQINNRTTFDYIKDEINYKKHIICCNFIEDWLDWGTSIRGAWFNTADGKIEPYEYLRNTGYKFSSIDITNEFMDWFVDWLCKE